jgi:general secretion pathway protein G
MGWLTVGCGGIFLILALGVALFLWFVTPRKLVMSNCSKAKADIVSIRSAIDSYAIEHSGTYPGSLLFLVTPDARGFTYLNAGAVPRDPWGREYEYFPPGHLDPEPIVRSLGSDGAPGGSGEAQDIDNLAIRSGKI